MKDNIIPVIFFMIAFSMGMDLHHTKAIEEAAIQSEKIAPQPGHDGGNKLKAYEVQVVWVRKGTVGGGAFPTYPDTDYDSGTSIIKAVAPPDSATVASQAEPPGQGYELDRIVSTRQLR